MDGIALHVSGCHYDGLILIAKNFPVKSVLIFVHVSKHRDASAHLRVVGGGVVLDELANSYG